ncbi:E3 ubiquitin/ISG15 ligase TRIM25-like [Solea solea]|uniref:E3 ubiquitin/ISG15 ligase TRIM25-like n=1 Tax=Solea solea TaxID=90069 RepID=UPI00272C02B6|nr:E3 ubiquitin/ISG15 ligase TRIM25-like [Solea solea]
MCVCCKEKMANKQELFDCSVCLLLLEDPVMTECGHTYCLKCINAIWDSNSNGGSSYSCPQCRQTFFSRPVLEKNTRLSDLVEEHKRRTGHSSSAAAEDDVDVEPSLQCDVCTRRKQKACMFCRVCFAFYCDTHVQPHYEAPDLKHHSLIPASVRIQESICRRHFRPFEIHCLTDQQFICLTCAADDHKDHDTVTVEAEQREMQIKLEETKQDIGERVLHSQMKMAQLRDAGDSIRDAAWEACDDFERLCEEHVRSYVSSVVRKCSEMKDKLGEAEKAGVDWTDCQFGQLQSVISELKRREVKLNQLSLTEDPIQFIRDFQALGDLPTFHHSDGSLNTLTQFVTAQKDKLKNMSNNEKHQLYTRSEELMLLKKPVLPESVMSRKHLLTKHRNSDVEVDPDTVASRLCLSNSNREISWSDKDQAHPHHVNRFTFYPQALCRKGLEGNHYWEVEWDGGIVDVAVSYKGINRKGSGKDCCFGHNHLSWKLTCSSSGCTFWHNSLHKGRISAADCRRVGVHLDCEAGVLVFYSVTDSDRLTLLHQIQNTFTEPVYPGFSVDLGATLKICKI